MAVPHSSFSPHIKVYTHAPPQVSQQCPPIRPDGFLPSGIDLGLSCVMHSGRWGGSQGSVTRCFKRVCAAWLGFLPLEQQAPAGSGPWRRAVFIQSGCTHKTPHTGCPRQQKCICPQFEKLDVQDPGGGKVAPSCTSFPLLGCPPLMRPLWPHTPPLPVCVHISSVRTQATLTASSYLGHLGQVPAFKNRHRLRSWD